MKGVLKTTRNQVLQSQMCLARDELGDLHVRTHGSGCWSLNTVTAEHGSLGQIMSKLPTSVSDKAAARDAKKRLLYVPTWKHLRLTV